jgi:hypothetical protein
MICLKNQNIESAKMKKTKNPDFSGGGGGGADFRHFAKYIFKEEYSIANFPYLLKKKFEQK